MSRNTRHEVGVGALLLVAAGLAAWMALKVGNWSGLEEQVEVVAVFDDVAGLKQGAAVTVAGVEVGKVSELAVNFDKAHVGLSLDASADIRADVAVVLRARSLLGEKYIALVPGSAEADPLVNGAVIGNTVGQVEIDQLLARMGPLLESIDTDAIAEAARAFSSAFEEDPERLARMMADAEAFLGELRSMAATGEQVAAEASVTVSSLAGLGAHAEEIADRLNRVLADVEVAAGELPATANNLPMAIDDARAAISDARELIASLDDSRDLIDRVLQNLEEIDKWELRRLLREEGILVRMRESQVQPQPRGSVVDQRD